MRSVGKQKRVQRGSMTSVPISVNPVSAQRQGQGMIKSACTVVMRCIYQAQKTLLLLQGWREICGVSKDSTILFLIPQDMAVLQDIEGLCTKNLRKLMKRNSAFDLIPL